MWYKASGKRILDLIISLCALFLLMPIFGLLAFLVRIRLGSPIIFCQRRPGLNGRPFMLFKFRTMSNERDEDGALLSDTARMTSLGRFLRSTSLDELPEFLNVLKGDMSLVGPRPLLMQYLERYSSEQARRHRAKPGITGLAQISGRNAITWEEKFELDNWYIDRLSFRLDISILLRTLWKTVLRQGISEEGQATATEFKGSINNRPGNGNKGDHH